jgi:hypothetical protein
MISLLSERLVMNALDLRCIDINENAWKYNCILEVLNVLFHNNYIVLGGDVYKIDKQGREITATGDSWYFNKTSGNSDVIDSFRKASDYIKKYHDRNGESFCYSVVVEKYQE